MRCDVVAVGTELLLGQIVDTNSAVIGERLAAAGIESYQHVHVGDNVERIAAAIRTSLDSADAVIVCGGLGPTPDDVTRDAIAAVMGVELRRDEEALARIRSIFASRGREMVPINARQADVPEGAELIVQELGTAPGLVCPVGDNVVYALPGPPHELAEMLDRAVIPDLRDRAGDVGAILSRTLRTWGLTESALAEELAPRLALLEAVGNPTIAFLASGIEGIKVRITAHGADTEDAQRLLFEEEQAIRAHLGDLVFGADDQTMETVVAGLLIERDLTLAVAESMTGGLVASRLVTVPGASTWFRGGVVSYASEVKFEVLGVPEGPVVSHDAARAMASGVRGLLGADIGISVTGVAGPAEEEGHPVGKTFFGFAMSDDIDSVESRLGGDRQRIRQHAVITLLDHLRRRLTAT